ncbi:FliG C-terminal domain-containing protein [bacterium]
MRLEKIVIIILLFLLSLYSMPSAFNSKSSSTQENISEKIRTRIENFFDTYYKGRKYLVNVDVYSDYDQNEHLEVDILLNQEEFSGRDNDFLSSVMFSQAGLDITRGDILAVKFIEFEPIAVGINKKKTYTPKPAKYIDKENFLSKTYMYVFFGFLIVIVFIFIILFALILYLININKKITLMSAANFSKNDLLSYNADRRIPVQDLEVAGDFSFNKRENNVVSQTKSQDKSINENFDFIKSGKELDNNTEKFKFHDISKLPDQFLFYFLNDYDMKVLASILINVKSSIKEKCIQNLTPNNKEFVIKELEKLERLGVVSPMVIAGMREKLVDKVDNLIKTGKINI